MSNIKHKVDMSDWGKEYIARCKKEFPKKIRMNSGKVKKGTYCIEVDWNYPIQSWEFDDRGSDEEMLAKLKPRDIHYGWKYRKENIFKYAKKLKEKKLL